MKTIITGFAALLIIALSLIALAHGLERQANHNLAVVAEHLEVAR